MHLKLERSYVSSHGEKNGVVKQASKPGMPHALRRKITAVALFKICSAHSSPTTRAVFFSMGSES